MSVPYSYKAPNPGDDFKLKYEYRKGTDTAKTIIYLGGGPGAKIGQDHFKGIVRSQDYNLVIIDYRGTGCNKLTNYNVQKFGKKIFNRNYFANDTARIITDLALRAKDYIIYAHSYGTTVAPELSTIIQAQGLPGPAAIFMTGTVENTNSIKYLNCDGNCRFEKNFKQFLELMPQEEERFFHNIFKNDYKNFPNLLGVDGKFWRLYFWTQLANNPHESSLQLMSNIKRVLDDPDSTYNARLTKWAKETRKIYYPEQLPSASLKKKTSDIEEFFSSRVIRDFVLETELNWGNGNKYPNHPNEYNSNALRLKHPTIFMHGSSDFLTPIEMAENSFSNQLDIENKILVTLNAGHSYSATHLSCLNNVVDAVFKGVVINKQNYNQMFQSCSTIKIK
ncbi:MAG: hypothetical protein KAQ98_13915 [Bacteriovoracaceae bacterium]|nr:hypothetical protein [Bacteriovoracaceae bacterium]